MAKTKALISCVVTAQLICAFIFVLANIWFSDDAADIMSHGVEFHMSCVMRKSIFCLCENRCADQLRSHCEADQRLCFRYMDSTIPLLSKSKPSFPPSSVAAQAGLCQAWSETRKTGFLKTWLIWWSPYCRKK